MRHQRHAGGFTIAELLVVVVVVAILATITVVTFNGVRAQAYNTKIIANVQNYKEAIEIYRIKNGFYPKTTPEQNGDEIAVVCLGTGYPAGSCGTISDVSVHEDPAFNAAMMDVFGSAPAAVDTTLLPSGPELFIGAVYGNDTTNRDGFRISRTIQYALIGENVDCRLSGAYSYRMASGATACEIIIEGIIPQ